jgi:hypothetical protein
MKKREGSPFKGIGTVALKEAADHITSARMHLVMLLLLLTAGAAIYGAVNEIKATTAQSNYLFLNCWRWRMRRSPPSPRCSASCCRSWRSPWGSTR